MALEWSELGHLLFFSKVPWTWGNDGPGLACTHLLLGWVVQQMLSTELGPGWSGRRRSEVTPVPAEAEFDTEHEELIAVTQEKRSFCIPRCCQQARSRGEKALQGCTPCSNGFWL